MKFPIKNFFSKCDQIRRKLTFTEEILNGELLFLFNVMSIQNVISTCYKIMFPSEPISNKFASFLFEKQYALIYEVVVSRFFVS